jgi:hypothetical protein
MKNKTTPILTIPVRKIDDVVVVSSDPKVDSNKDQYIKINFYDERQSKKSSIIFRMKNTKHINVIQHQIDLLRDAEVNSSTQKKIKGLLNPELCNTCLEEEYVFEFSADNKLCHNCFKERYGQILLQSDAAEYHGGHRDHILGGILAKHQSGTMYLTENYLIFAKEDKDISKRWQITIPLSSVILHLDLEDKRKKLVEWVGTNTDNFGLAAAL